MRIARAVVAGTFLVCCGCAAAEPSAVAPVGATVPVACTETAAIPGGERPPMLAATMKIVVEPTGGLGFAAARRLGAELAGQRVGVLISGGNVDVDRFAALLGGARADDPGRIG